MEIENVFLETLQREIGNDRYDVWFGGNVRIALRDSALVITAPDVFRSDWLRSKFKHIIGKVANNLFHKTYPMKFLVAENSLSSATPEVTKRRRTPAESEPTTQALRTVVPPATNRIKSSSPEHSFFQLDRVGESNVMHIREQSKPHFSWAEPVREFASYQSFVEGKSNSLAKSIADIVIREPGKFNPVLIYGPTSVGKTHLLEGIWSEYYHRDRKKQPLFLTADQFTTLFVQEIRGQSRMFRNRFKNISLLVLDDLHLLQGRPATQTELLNLIDLLNVSGIQMVFSSDRPLGELSGLRSELVSRLTSGIDCRIEAAERETLLAIFRQMIVRRQLIIPDEVCRYVVSRYATHARQLSGILNKLYALHLARSTPIDLSLAQEVLSDFERSTHRNVPLSEVERAVLELFGITSGNLRSPSKAKANSYPRMIAMWLARKYTDAALSEIGQFFGNRSHSTVVSALKRVNLWLEQNAPHELGTQRWNIAEMISRLERTIQS